MKLKAFLINTFMMLFLSCGVFAEEKADLLNKAQALQSARQYSEAVKVWQNLYDNFENPDEQNEYFLLMLAQDHYRLDLFDTAQIYALEGLNKYPNGKHYQELQYYFGRAKQDLKEKLAYDEIKQVIYNESSQLFIVGVVMIAWIVGFIGVFLFKRDYV